MSKPQLILLRRITQRQLHHKSVELRLGQGVGPGKLYGVLCCYDHKEAINVVSCTIYGDFFLLHGFKQCGLGLGRSTVDLICQENIAHHRAGSVIKGLGSGIIYGKSGDIGRQCIR